MTITETKRPEDAATTDETETKEFDVLRNKRLKLTERSTENPAVLAPITPNDDCMYAGYSFQTIDSRDVPFLSVDVVSPDSKVVTTGGFFESYIAQRKPCVLDFWPSSSSSSTETDNNSASINITKELLNDLAGDKTIQVERRFSVKENFGQNRTASRQIFLSVSDFMDQISSQAGEREGELLYWSTQEDTDDPFNVPCRQLVDAHKIPAHLAVAGNLVLSSCNLWVGVSRAGASSGLHHDYHDNFYLLLKGRKRFRLFSPDCAPHLGVYGTIDKIYPNGRISYVGNKTRADGVPLSSLSPQQRRKETIDANDIDDEHDDANDDKNGDDEEDDDDEEEEIVLGKGFDYVSDESGDEGFDQDNQNDDFEELVGLDNDNNNNMAKADSKDDSPSDKDKKQNGNYDNHPDSFSRINPCRADTKALEKEFPAFAKCRQVFVDLQAGQTLYLPAGWFHEVTSYSTTTTPDKDEDDKANPTTNNSLDNCHMALNYWYHPPDALDNYDNPYQDDFWKKEEQERLQKQEKDKCASK